MMETYQLSQPQKILGAALLAIAIGLSVVLVSATRELESQMAVSDKVIVTREVKLQLSGNDVENNQTILKHEQVETAKSTQLARQVL